MYKEAAIPALGAVAPTVMRAGGHALKWGAKWIAPNMMQLGRTGLKADAARFGRGAWRAGKGVGSMMMYPAMFTTLDKISHNSALKEQQALYEQMLPLNRQRLARRRMQQLALYGGSSIAGGVLGYTLSEKNKRRNALLGALISPIAAASLHGIYDRMNVSPEQYTKQEVGLS